MNWRFFACTIGIASAALGQAPNRVIARDYFESPSKSIVIDIPDDSVLVFDAVGGDYLTNGRSVDIKAHRIEVAGEVHVRAFAVRKVDSTRAANGSTGSDGGFVNPGEEGGDGEDGRDGVPGRSAGSMNLDLAGISGSGEIWFDNDGEDGEEGQSGGSGGLGGDGGVGDHRNCPSGDGVQWTTVGGPGGPGGRGGSGGNGGDGGNGGQIHLRGRSIELVKSGKVHLSAFGGHAGRGGSGAVGGTGGRGGFYGPPSPFQCGSYPGPLVAQSGRDGASGTSGKSGITGTPGILQQF